MMYHSNRKKNIPKWIARIMNSTPRTGKTEMVPTGAAERQGYPNDCKTKKELQALSEASERGKNYQLKLF